MKPRIPCLVVLSVLVVVAPLTVGASPERLASEDYLRLLRVDLRTAKAELVTNALELTTDELTRFWPIYREYDQALALLNNERIAVLREYAASYTHIDDVQAQALARRSLEFQRKRLDLLEKTFDRIARAFNAGTAARFLQIEHQMLLLVDVQIASDLPLIPRRVLAEPGR